MNWFRGAALLAVAVGTLVGRAAHAQEAQALQVTFLDVGQGDAVLVRAPEGQTMLVDTGWGGITPLLEQVGVTAIDLLVSSHPHADHIGGTAEVINALPVRFYMDNAQPHTTAIYQRLLGVLESRPDITYLVAEPRMIQLGSAAIEVLPLPALGTVDHNNRSVTLVITFGAFSVFLSGDSERRELDHFVRLGVVPDITVLKAPHHGSDNGFTSEFLRLSQPEVVVISVGPNSYGHPRQEALLAYSSTAGEVYRTDQHGQVTVLGHRDGSYEVLLDREPRLATSVSPGPGATAPPPPTAPPAPRRIDGSAARVSISVFADAPGNDNGNRNGEYVILRNDSAVPLSISQWTLCDAVQHCFRFPRGAMIPGGQGIVLFTGSGVSDGISFYMNSGTAVWNNDGDVASLLDDNGALVATQAYD